MYQALYTQMILGFSLFIGSVYSKRNTEYHQPHPLSMPVSGFEHVCTTQYQPDQC